MSSEVPVVGLALDQMITYLPNLMENDAAMSERLALSFYRLDMKPSLTEVLVR